MKQNKNSGNWGSIFKMKPSKIVHYLLDRELPDDEIYRRMEDEFQIVGVKAKKLLEICKLNRKYIFPYNEVKNKVALYIAIPFCPSKCSYCSFPSTVLNKKTCELKDRYLKTLHYEIREILEVVKEKRIEIRNIYIGGGTPAVLSVDEMRELFDVLSDFVELKSLEEFTFEGGRVDCLDHDKLQFLKDNHVTRICLNTQTLDDEILKSMNRKHTAKEFLKMYKELYNFKFNVVNVDLIAGFTDQKLDSYKNTLQTLVKYRPGNITVHTLAKKSAADLRRTDYFEKHENVESKKMIVYTDEFLSENGYKPYYIYRQRDLVSDDENTGYCLDGKESIFNIYMIEERFPILAFGAGAVSKLYEDDQFSFKQIKNAKEASHYIVNIESNIKKKIERLKKIYG